jgi:hypothetical protein
VSSEEGVYSYDADPPRADFDEAPVRTLRPSARPLPPQPKVCGNGAFTDPVPGQYGAIPSTPRVTDPLHQGKHLGGGGYRIGPLHGVRTHF